MDTELILEQYPAVQFATLSVVDGKEVVLCVLDENIIMPQSLPEEIDGLPVVVESAPTFTDCRMMLDAEAESDSSVQSFQSCQNFPIPGGVQIQPRGAGWVGTLTCLVRYGREQRLGGLSNNHVINFGALGNPIHQPSSSRPPIGKLAAVHPISFSQRNEIDAAIFDCEVTQNGQARHSLDHKQFAYNRPLARKSRKFQIGDVVAKTGRTTGYRTATCIGVGGTSRIQFGSQTALFVGLDSFRAPSGLFSGPGDSGSAIFDQSTGEIGSLLFAGGGGITLGCPIWKVERDLQVSFDI